MVVAITAIGPCQQLLRLRLPDGRERCLAGRTQDVTALPRDCRPPVYDCAAVFYAFLQDDGGVVFGVTPDKAIVALCRPVARRARVS